MKISLPTIIHILIQCKLMLGYSFFSVIVGIKFQQFQKQNLKNPLKIQNKSSFEAKITYPKIIRQNQAKALPTHRTKTIK